MGERARVHGHRVGWPGVEKRAPLLIGRGRGRVRGRRVWVAGVAVLWAAAAAVVAGTLNRQTSAWVPAAAAAA